MPLHDFQCQKCNKVFTEILGINEEVKARCECGGKAKKIWNNPAKAVIYFNEGFCLSLGKYFKTEREYKNYIHDNGYTRL